MKTQVQKLTEAGIKVENGKIALADLDRAIAILESQKAIAEYPEPKFLVMMIESAPNREDPKGELEALAEEIVKLTEELHPTGSMDWEVMDAKSGDMKTIKLP